MRWSRLRAQVLARVSRMRGTCRAFASAPASTGPRAPDWAALGVYRGGVVLLMRNHRHGGAYGRFGHPLSCFLSTEAARGKTDLAADWLRKLGDCWRELDIYQFLMAVDGSYRKQHPVSRVSLKAAADAVLQAHTDATMVCRRLGGGTDEVTSALRAANGKSADGFRGMPGISDEVAEMMERLHRAGVLDSLQDDSTVRYFRAKQAYVDYSLMSVRFDKLVRLREEAEAAEKAREAAAKARDAALEKALDEARAAKKTREDEVLEKIGLPVRHPHPKCKSQTWTPNVVEGWCAEADAVGFRTACGRSASEFILTTCRIQLDRTRYESECETVAFSVLEALQVLVQAMAVARKADALQSESLVLSGAPGSHREEVLFSAIEAVLYTAAIEPLQYKNNKLLVGAKGMGKSSLFQAIGLAMAILDYANPDLIICPAYVSSPSGVIPEAYLADAMHQRGILTGADGVLPA